MNNYTTVAKQKIKDLMESELFEKVETENSRYTILKFADKIYKVTYFGNTTWSDPLCAI